MSDESDRMDMTDVGCGPTGCEGAVRWRWLGVPAGVLAAVTAWWLLPGGVEEGGLSEAGRLAAAVGVLMAVWWLTEAVPLAVTSLLPLVLLPGLGVMSVKSAAAPYADDVIYLFMGGFMLGLSMQKWGLHRRIALRTVLLVGTSPARIVGGLMLAAGVMSMWVSNTATVMVMLPIGVSLVALVRGGDGGGGGGERERRNFGRAVVLGVAYASSIGGTGTLLGSPPNLIAANFIRGRYGQDISMLEWAMVGVPLVAVFLPLTWVVLTRVVFPVGRGALMGGREMIESELRSLGPMKVGEWVTMVVFFCAAGLWIARPWLVKLSWLHHVTAEGRVVEHVTDSTIAVGAALVLFVAPVSWRTLEPVLDWRTAVKLPWSVLILFGGGLSLAAALTLTGVDAFVGARCGALGEMPGWVMLLVLVAVVVFATEFTSNTALATALMPVLAGVAAGAGMHPYVLMIPACIAASYAFMLPVGTAPNAIAYASGQVSGGDMARAGLVLNVIGIVLVTLFFSLAGSLVLGEDLSVVPEWALPGADGVERP